MLFIKIILLFLRQIKIYTMGNKLKETRKKLGIRQKTMSKDLDITAQTLVNWEKSNSLSIDKIERCANYLKVDKTELI
jgi:transcriptional regulator with XRE-family HTH domain